MFIQFLEHINYREFNLTGHNQKKNLFGAYKSSIKYNIMITNHTKSLNYYLQKKTTFKYKMYTLNTISRVLSSVPNDTRTHFFKTAGIR